MKLKEAHSSVATLGSGNEVSLSALLSTLFTLNSGQFSLKINCTWSCMAPSGGDAPIPWSRETEKIEVLNVFLDLES